MSVSFVSFGDDSSWVVGFDNDSLCWSGLSKSTGKFLNRHRKYSDIRVFDMGDNDDYFAYRRGDGWNYSLNTTLTESNINKVICFTMGPDSSYIMIHRDGIEWQGIPKRATELIQTRNNATLEWAALGYKGSYVLIYSDGAIYWGGNICNSLSSELETNPNIKKVYLCASSDRYFVLNRNESSSWRADTSFSNAIQSDTYMSPQNIAYINSSIKDTFVCGTSIYETADDLESDEIEVEDIPCITVIKYQNVTYTLNNRRLWVFKQCEMKSIPVIIENPDPSFMKRVHCINRPSFNYIRIR